MGLVFHSPEEAIAAVGMQLGASEWLTIDQARIDTFAEATGDFQWIHVDPDGVSVDGARGFSHRVPSLATKCLFIDPFVKPTATSGWSP